MWPTRSKTLPARSFKLTILVITNRALTTASNGYDLRVWHLCRALAAHERLVQLVLPISEEIESTERTLILDNIFVESFTSIRIDSFKPRLLRHLRLSEDGFYQWGYPWFQEAVTAQIKRICDQFDIQNIMEPLRGTLNGIVLRGLRGILLLQGLRGLRGLGGHRGRPGCGTAPGTASSPVDCNRLVPFSPPSGFEP